MKTPFLTALTLGLFTAVSAQAQTSTFAAEDFTAGAYTATDGEALYQSFCAGCHMPDGSGAEGAGEYPALANNQNLEFSAYAAHVIINGQGAMPALGSFLDDEQMVSLLTYLQTNLGNDYEPDATLELVADTRPFDPEEELAEHEIQEQRRMDATGVPADIVVRHAVPGSDFPILSAVEVPRDATLVYLSGTVPQVVDEDADRGSADRYGDTKAQTISTLASIEEKLTSLDLSMGDVIKMQVYLVAPDGSETMDFSGFMEGYVQYFGTDEQPNLPTRSVFEVAGLANPAWLVEIEVVAVRGE
ncbi:Rid family hydrolase [Thalassorhabdomicrobium marinisediminis]|uniref:Rid family hydrolase n=1 Tax=Thalassorhabdomicrobium marinisediminis TaxID=2170577 RepID=UPI002491AD01|nr:Rid family hydrolase [Thalassorhabdomicrobium marinisediminis]